MTHPQASDADAPLVVFRPNPGPQRRFLATAADEALYGGAAGGGKSAALLALPLRWVDNPRFRCLYLRRESQYLGDAIDKSSTLYPKLGGRLVRTPRIVWTFPSGATIWLNHCEHEKDVANYDSFEFNVVLFDELTHFTRRQFAGLGARLRTTDRSLPTILRGATNPGGEGHEWVFERFAAWLDPKHPRPAAPGELRWFLGDEEATRETPDASSRTFIPALLADNPHISEDYRKKLVALDPLRRAQLLSGDWLKRAAPKELWDRDKILHLDAPPSLVRARVRCWDFAASEDRSADWTVGTLASITAEGLVVIEHVHRFRGAPAKVRAEFSRVAQDDRARDPRTVQWIPQDPGQAGKDQVLSYQSGNPGITVRARPVSSDKIVRFGPASARALAGTLALVRGAWNSALHDELEAAPGPKGSKDDQLDTVSDCVAVLTGAVPATLDPPRQFPKPRL